MNLKKLAMIAIAGTMAFGLAACTEDSGTNGSIDNGNHGSLRDRDGDDNTPSTVGPNGYDYKDSRSYRDYTADLTVGSVKHSVVRIGDQLWMGENLNDPSAGHCYNDDEDYCKRFGRLYSWAEAMNLDNRYNYEDATLKIKNKHQGICPEGWRIPTSNDFKKMLDFIFYDYDHGDIAQDNGFDENDDISGIQLKSTNFDAYDDVLWNSKNGVPGEDTYGFYGIGTGYGDTYLGEDDYGDTVYTYEYSGIAEFTKFWTATPVDGADGAEVFILTFEDRTMSSSWEYKEDLFPVRCMKDF